jgi:hypothetical protein
MPRNNHAIFQIQEFPSSFHHQTPFVISAVSANVYISRRLASLVTPAPPLAPRSIHLRACILAHHAKHHDKTNNAKHNASLHIIYPPR